MFCDKNDFLPKICNKYMGNVIQLHIYFAFTKTWYGDPKF